MSIDRDIETLNFSQATSVLRDHQEALQPAMVIGDPGLGKTALARMLAASADLPLSTLIGSTLDPTDVGGMPIVVKGELVRVPLKAIREVAKAPGVLFLDEVSTAVPAVQAAFLRLILDRAAGDLELHAKTWVLAAANPPEQSPGGFELSAPLVGRVALYKLRPSNAEVLDYFATLGDEGTPLRAEAVDFALTADVMPNLLQVDIPAGCVAGNKPWGAPRSWERAIRARAAAVARGEKASDELARRCAGSVGRDLADAYESILKLRSQLPSIPEIVADPANAPLPADKRYQVAALGLVPRVAEENTWAAWAYAARLQPELAVACAARLLQKKDSPLSMKHAQLGARARSGLSAKVVRVPGLSSAVRS